MIVKLFGSHNVAAEDENIAVLIVGNIYIRKL
jgi:hypothetical protein